MKIKKVESKELPDFLTKKYVMQYLDVCDKTVERMFRQGLQRVKLGRRIYIRKQNLIDFIERTSKIA